MYMKTMLSGILCCLCILMIAGCSVKENRENCPCRLVMDMTGIDTSLVKKVKVLAVCSDGVVFTDSLTVDDFSRLYVRDVPRRDMTVNVWGSEDRHEELKIPYGLECPPIYMHAFSPDTRKDECLQTIDLKKNHCRLTVLIDGRDDLPYCLTFKGDVDGYLVDGRPSSGDFSCVAYPADDAGAQVILPRQRDASLMLEIEDVDKAVTRSFAIGEYMYAGGYDWGAESLEDATVIIDYYLTGIKITYKEWDKEYSYDIIL